MDVREKMAEGARFELAVPLRGLRFSRPVRSATPAPLQTKLARPGDNQIVLADGIDTISELLRSLDPTGSPSNGSWRPDKCLQLLLPNPFHPAKIRL
jgi:hypothetical protein